MLSFTCSSVSGGGRRCVIRSTLRSPSQASRRCEWEIIGTVQSLKHGARLLPPSSSCVQSTLREQDGALKQLLLVSEIASLSSGQVPEMAAESPQLFNIQPAGRSDSLSNPRTQTSSGGPVDGLGRRGLRQSAAQWIGPH